MRKDWRSNPKYYLVPAALCDLVMREKSFREFQTYLALKAICSGQLRLNTTTKNEIATVLGISVRTFNRALNKLVTRDWIGYNIHSGIHFIRSFDQVLRFEGLHIKRAYWFDISLIKKLKSFVIAANYAEILRTQRRRLAEVQKRGRTKHKASLPFYLPVALNYCCQVFNIAKSTASRHRAQAIKDGFLVRKHNLLPVLNGDKVLSAENLPLLRSVSDLDDARKFIVKNGGIYEQFPDLIATKLTSKKRRKIVHRKVDKKRTIK